MLRQSLLATLGVGLMVSACGSESNDSKGTGGAGGSSAMAGSAGSGASGGAAGASGTGGSAGASSGGSAGSGGSGGEPACRCDAGASVACSELSKLYAAGAQTATCRADCGGYDVSACTRVPGNQVETVYPALRDPRWKDALCNDGTPFWFKVSLTGSRKWVVNFEGGGACDGALIPCARRMLGNPALFSSKDDPADGTVSSFSGSGTAVLSRDPSLNPEFNDANIVLSNYCSSDLWGGANTTPQTSDLPIDLVFTGRINARSVVDTLIQRFGFDDSADLDILVTGSSAGGNGARNNADLVATAFPNARSRQQIWVLPVAGFQVYEWDYPTADVGGGSLADPIAWEAAYKRFGADLNPKCIALAAADGHGPGACFPGIYATRSLILPEPAGYGLRLFDATNRTDPVYLNYHGVSPARSDFQAIADAWQPRVTQEMLDSGVRWLLAPAHRGPPNLHGVFEEWNTPFPAYDAASDPCSSPYPTTLHTFKEMVSAFYHDASPATSSMKVCIPHPWPE